MKILLLGEYSNVHATLAKGLRGLGHEVTVASNGDFWKDYPRDIDLARKPGLLGGVSLMWRIYRALPQLKGYDVVQIINPLFVELKARRIASLYRMLRAHNKCVVLGAFGMDYYWVNGCTYDRPLRYSDFNIGDELRTNPDALREREDWLNTPKGELNKQIAHDCDAIVAGLYEYWAVYAPHFKDKTQFIPYPIVSKNITIKPHEGKLKLFIGINRSRSEYKGTDIMLQAAKDVARNYHMLVELRIAENIPFNEYVEMMNGSDAILDQLYSYTPAMNALEAMSRGIICVGGGEPENYDILGEKALKPIINVLPTYESVYHELEKLALNPDRIDILKRQSIEYIRMHHDYMKVARQYEQLYLSKLWL